MSKRMEIVDVAIRRNGKFLAVTNRKHDGFTMPGGKVEPTDSSPKHAAIRELEEETGIKVSLNDLYYIGSFEFPWRGQPLQCHSFAVRLHPTINWQEPRAVEEGTEILWVDRDALLDMDGDCLSPVFYGWLFGRTGW